MSRAAADSRRYDTVAYLRDTIKHGSDADLHDILERGRVHQYVDKLHSTPLHLACTEGRWDLVGMLIEYGADVFAADHRRRTPGDIAALHPYQEEYICCVRMVACEMRHILTERALTTLEHATSNRIHEFLKTM